MSTNPYESPHTAGGSPVRGTLTFSRVLVRSLVVVGILGIVVVLLLPARRSARGAARKMACSNHLHSIAIALKEYEAKHGALPPAYSVDAQGKPLHSWRTLILPYLEEKELFEKIDLSKPWDDPANKAAYEKMPLVYQCPSTELPANHTAYLAIVSARGCFQPTKPRRLADITDSHDTTLMVIEVGDESAVHWMSPNDANEELVLSLGKSERLPHSWGFHTVSVSATVRHLDDDTKPEFLRAAISIAGRDDVIAQKLD